MLDCEDAIEDLKDDLKDLAQQKFDNVTTEFENQISLIEHEIELIDLSIDQMEERGYLVSSKFYNNMINHETDNLERLKGEYSTLTTTLQGLLDDGLIKKYSDQWYEMQQEINDVSEAIVESNTSLIEYQNSIRDLQWENFDMLLEKMGEIKEESEFLIDLMSNEKLFDTDTGEITKHGQASLGLHAVNYNALMAQADEYGKEREKIGELLKVDPYNLTLMERYNELTEEQREAILDAQDAFEDAISIIEDGFDAFLDAMDKAINKRKDALDATKDLYDYEKEIAEHTKEIGNLEKQLNAYRGDNSEESRATVQQLKTDLEEARQNLEETEYDRYISDQEQMLDTLYDKTEEWINQRLDDRDWLLQQLIDYTNANAGSIQETVKTEADSVGYELSNAMKDIWNPGGTYATVVAGYVEGFTSLLTTTNSVLDKIRSYMAKMVGESDEKAEEQMSEASKPVDIPEPPEAPEPPKPQPAPKPANNGGDGTPRVGDSVTYASGVYTSDSEGHGRSGSMYRGQRVYITKINNASWASRPYHISTGNRLGSGDLGWVTLSQLQGYKTGGLVDKTAPAMLHGTKSKPELVLNAKDTENFIELKDILSKISTKASNGLGIGSLGTEPSMFKDLEYSTASLKSALSNSNIIPHVSSTQKVSQSVSIDIGDIQMYGVNNPKEFAEQLKYALQNNKDIYKIVQSDTLGLMMGKNSLSKFKY